MSNNISVSFLGTTSGGGPTETRNCSSLVIDALGNGSLWMVDCAEGTVRQFQQQPYRPGQHRLKLSQISKIFITHMHADHTMGILTFLRNVLGIPKPKFLEPSTPPNFFPPRVEIFGPRGIRRMLRMLWHMTHTRSEYSYVVHELLFPGEQPSVPADVKSQNADEVDVRRESECCGRDIWCEAEGYWRSIVTVPFGDEHAQWGAIVDAGPIKHRDPCIGYVIREVPRGRLQPDSAAPRKLVILGDTSDPSPIIPLVHHDPEFASILPEVNPYDNGVFVRVPVTLLVHEATDACIPPSIDTQSRTGKNRTHESVQAKMLERGHSTPAMAGDFARRIGAERLVLNHIGARFPAPDVNYNDGANSRFRAACMREIERQAAEAWNPKRRMQPQAAWDFLSIALQPNQEQWRSHAHEEGAEMTGQRRSWDQVGSTSTTVPPAGESSAPRLVDSLSRGNGHNDRGVDEDEGDVPAQTQGVVSRAIIGPQMFTWRVGDGSWTRNGAWRQYNSSGAGRARGKPRKERGR